MIDLICNYRDRTSDEVRHSIETAKATQQAITAELGAAQAAIRDLANRLTQAQVAADHGVSVLAWRARVGRDDGDIEHELQELAARINAGGATLRSIRNDGADGPGHATITDHAGRTWRVTFAGGVGAFWPVNYSALADAEAQVAGSTITDAGWDDPWLLEGFLPSGAELHIRLFGEPISVEEVLA